MLFIYFLILITAYIIGSIPFAYMLGRKIDGIDIRQQGSGNAGARNVARCLGFRYGFLTAVLDILKGALPMVALTEAGYSGCIILAAGGMLVAGHNWPVGLAFKGGSGLAVSVGIMLSLAFRITVFAALAALFLGWLSKKIKPVSEFASPLDVEMISGYIFLPVLLFSAGEKSWVVIMPLLLGIIMLPRRIVYINKNKNESENTFSARDIK